ncbi:MAG: transcriptional modulator of MazE/toxin, MazF [Clostridia bacterium]|jgi:mRNA interferase MazF|nr:transcriptional modulator of MazE/toxin, MazF [Clostridia bacterium]
MNIDYSQITNMLDWLKEKLRLDANASSAKRRTVKRGQVYRCNFGCGVGSEMNKERPSVIIQNDIGNQHSGNTIVIPITHDSSSLPCVANLIPQQDANGSTILDGQANASNMLCVSKARLGNFVCELPKSEMKKIDEAIAKSVDIMVYYSELSKKLENRDSFIEKLKVERNQAQDELKELRVILNVGDGETLKDYAQKIKKSIDSNSND